MAMKRANGTGTVYKMKHKALRKPYRAVVTLGYNSEGKPLRKSIGTFATQKEAYNALSAYDANAPQYEAKDTTFGQCWEWMIEDKTRLGINLEKSGYVYNKPKVEHLMRVPIKDIRLTHLQDIIDRYSDMSRTALSQIKTVLKSTFDIAIKNDIVDKNYASLVTLPSKPKSDMHKPFTPVEIYKLWELSETDRNARVLLTCVYTGMRPGEIQKIKLKDVHIKEHYMIGGIKTEAGKNRIIPIADCIMPFIKEWYRKSSFERGEYLMPSDIPKNLRPALSVYLNRKFDDHRPHDARHTCATLLIHIGVAESTVKTILGHRHSDVTNQVYVHRDATVLVDAVNKLPSRDELLRDEFQALTYARG